MPKVIAFDVNETLLDVAGLDPFFEKRFGDAAVRREWFGQMLQSAFVTPITDSYRDFGTLAMAALVVIAARHRVELRDAGRSELGTRMRSLPSHPEVRSAMERLHEASLRLATLTNSTSKASQAQLVNARLADLVEQTLYADTVRRLKPAPEPYRMAAERLGVPGDGMRLAAASTRLGHCRWGVPRPSSPGPDRCSIRLGRNPILSGMTSRRSPSGFWRGTGDSGVDRSGCGAGSCPHLSLESARQPASRSARCMHRHSQSRGTKRK